VLVSRVALQKPAGGVGEKESSSSLGKPMGGRLKISLAQNGEGDLETPGGQTPHNQDQHHVGDEDLGDP